MLQLRMNQMKMFNFSTSNLYWYYNISWEVLEICIRKVLNCLEARVRKSQSTKLDDITYVFT